MANIIVNKFYPAQFQSYQSKQINPDNMSL